MKLNQLQQKVINHTGSCVVVGAPGTGKTVTLLEKVRALLAQKIKPEEIAIATFSRQSKIQMLDALNKLIPQEASKLKVDGFRYLSLAAMERDEDKKINVPEERFTRRLIRQTMREVDFDGTAVEAEHIIRKFKSRARKPHENERFFSLLQKYRSRQPFDGYDVVRKHLLGMRKGDYRPVSARYIFVDNFQDISEVQLLWLFDHMKAGVTVYAFGDDDLKAFTRDGALGKSAFDGFCDEKEVESFTLTTNYRHDGLFFKSMQTVLKPLKDRLPKETVCRDLGFTFQVQRQDSLSTEMETLGLKVKELCAQYKRVGIITRSDWQALRVQRLLEKAKIPHSSYATPLWDVPGAIMMLDLLLLLVNQAQDRHLKNVLTGYGLGETLVDALLGAGLQAHDFLKNGAELPKDVELPAATLKEYMHVQRALLGYYNLMVERQVTPQEAFKAAAYDMLENMNNEDRSRALVAVDVLLSIKGSLLVALKEVSKVALPLADAQVTVAPVDYVRNMEFDWVLMPRCSGSDYPKAGYRALGSDVVYDRHLFYMGISRAKEGLSITYTGKESPYVAELRKAYHKPKRQNGTGEAGKPKKNKIDKKQKPE